VYETVRKQQYDIYRMPVTPDLRPDGAEELLIGTQDVERAPQFLPNGDLAYLKSFRDGKRNPVLYRVSKGLAEEALTPETLRVLAYTFSPNNDLLILSAYELGRQPNQARAVLYQIKLRTAGSVPELLYKDPVGNVGSPSIVP
jgi:hypothetical protein